MKNLPPEMAQTDGFDGQLEAPNNPVKPQYRSVRYHDADVIGITEGLFGGRRGASVGLEAAHRAFDDARIVAALYEPATMPEDRTFGYWPNAKGTRFSVQEQLRKQILYRVFDRPPAVDLSA